MLGFRMDLTDAKQNLRVLRDRQVRVWGGLAFTVLAMAAIQYDELIAPNLNKLTGAWSGVALDLGRKITSFTL